MLGQKWRPGLFFEIWTSNLFCPSFPLILRGKPSWKSIRPKFTILASKISPKIPFCPSGNHQKAYSSYHGFNKGNVRSCNKKGSTIKIFRLRRAHIMFFSKGNVRSWNKKGSTFKFFEYCLIITCDRNFWWICVIKCYQCMATHRHKFQPIIFVCYRSSTHKMFTE